MRSHPRLLLALTVVLAVAGCGPTSPSPLPPPAGIQLEGNVLNPAWQPIPGARVEVVAGAGAGLFTVPDPLGFFELSGPFDDTTRVRATANGHLDATLPFPARCATCTYRDLLNFYLEPTAHHADLAGHHLLTFTADSGCPSLPEEARERTYSATVTRSTSPNAPGDSQFAVTFSGPMLLDQPALSSSLGVAGDYMYLSVGELGYGIVEEVVANTFIALRGVAQGSVGLTATEIVLPFSGTVNYCVLSGPAGPFYYCTPSLKVTESECRSSNHRLVLRRLD